MHNDHDILTTLRAYYAERELTSVVGRLLRVPEAWRALRNPAFLDELMASEPPLHLTPSHLATAALGGEVGARIDPQLAEPHRARAAQLWQEAQSGSAPPAELFETALLGVTMAERAAEGEFTAEQAAADPRRWSSVLCVAWPALGQPESWLGQLLKHGAYGLAVQAALANLAVDEAASYLTRNANGSTVGMLLYLWRAGEHDLVRSMAPPNAAVSNYPDSLAPLLLQAVGEQSRGEPDTARAMLAQAWESANRVTAHIADFTADLARQDRDAVTEAEANRRALEIAPSAERRARAARATAEVGRTEQALVQLSTQDLSVEELIVLGSMQIGQQQAETIRQAATLLLNGAGTPDYEWYPQLCQELESAGELELSIAVAESQVAAFPASAGAHHNLAALLGRAGDWEGSLNQAELAVALNPNAVAPRELLAEAHEQIGDYAAALEQRGQLAATDPKLLAETAIQAGELDYAGSVVEQLLAENPSSVTAHLALGRILAAQGEQASAGAAFQEALRLDPQRIEVQLAHAGWLQSSGQTEAAGKTLMQAVQLDPSRAEVQSALADWLIAEGRSSEAVEASANATESDPDNLEFRLQHAKLLAELGHHEAALAELETAALRAPRDWRVNLAAAQALAQAGDPEGAALRLPALPKWAGAAEWLAAGRIGVQAERDLAAALQALTTAEELGSREPELHYWIARALELTDRHQTAVERYSKALDTLDPADAELREQATLGVARCELESGRISAALEVLDRARETLGGGARILAQTARVYRSAKLLDKAIEVAREAVEMDADDPSGWQALTESLASDGDFDGAIAAAERHSALQPRSIEPWLQIAQLAARSEQISVARQALAKAMWRGRNDPFNLAHAAETFSAIDKSASAIRTMRAAVRLQPSDLQLRRKLAALLEDCGEFGPAQQAWLEYGELAPDGEHALLKAASCADRLGNSFEAVELLEQAQQVNPKSPGLRRQLASAYIGRGEIARGIQTYSSALRESPNDASLAMEAAEAALRAGAAREALGFVGRAQQLAADERRVQAALGEGYLLLDEPEKAESALQRAIELGDSSARVLAMLALIDPRGRQSLAEASAENAHDAVWIARAHVQYLQFAQALEALRGWQAETAVALELARTALRAHDAQWLLSYADCQPEQPLGNIIERTLDELHVRQVEASTLAPLYAWQAALHDPEALTAYLEHDSTGELGEALVVSQLRAGAFDQAAQSVERIRELYPRAQWLNLLEGICLETSQRPEQARAAFRRAAEAGPLAPLAQYLIGRSYATHGSFERAARHIGKAAAQWLQMPQWQFALGRAYQEMDDHDSALGHFQTAAETVPDRPDYQLALAKAFQACGHLAQAETAYQRTLAAPGASAETYRLAGEVALQIGRADLASERFEYACELTPEDALAHIGAAGAAAALGNRHAAEKHLRSAIQLDPTGPEILLGQGQVLMQTGKSAAAMQAFSQALEAGADPALVHRHQSKLLLKQGEVEKGLRSLRQAVNADPDDDQTWHELALALEAQSDFNPADQAVAQALRIAPRNPEYRLTLARISRRAGNLDRAIEELRQARSAVPDDARLAVEVGLVHEDRREYSRALDAYREAIEIDGECLDAYYRAGLLLRTLKAYRRAGEMLKHAAELAPVNQEVLHQLAAVRALELVHG